MEEEAALPAAPAKRRLILLDEVIARTGLSRTRVYTDAGFPAPVWIGKRRSAWVEDEIDDWINERIAERDARIAEEKR